MTAAGSIYTLLPGFIPEYTSFQEDFEKGIIILNFSQEITPYTYAVYDSIVLYSLYSDLNNIIIRYENASFNLTRDFLKKEFGNNIFNIIDNNEILELLKERILSYSESEMLTLLNKSKY